jgi:hypothetical protein
MKATADSSVVVALYLNEAASPVADASPDSCVEFP